MRLNAPPGSGELPPINFPPAAGNAVI